MAVAKGPTAQEIAQAIAAASEDKGIAKYAAQALAAVFLALIFWVGATLLSLNNTVTRMSANVDTLSKSISDLQASQNSSSKTIGDLQASTAREGARTDAVEADISRVKERLRILEGQPPVTTQDANRVLR